MIDDVNSIWNTYQNHILNENSNPVFERILNSNSQECNIVFGIIFIKHYDPKFNYTTKTPINVSVNIPVSFLKNNLDNPKRIKAAVIRKVRQHLENKPNLTIPNNTIDIFFHRTLSNMIRPKQENIPGYEIVLTLVNKKPHQMEFDF